MKYQLVIFDLDGTILDTLDDLADSANVAMKMSGYPQRTRAEIRSFVGNGIKNLIIRCVPKGISTEDMEQTLEYFKKYYGVHCADKTKPYDGVLEMLRELRQKGYQTAVVSNKADFAVQELCQQYFPGLFDYVVGEREGVRKKPAPDSVEEVLRKFQVKKDAAVYVGDSEVDIATAQNAQMAHIIVDWGFRDRVFLESCGAKTMISKPKELMEYL